MWVKAREFVGDSMNKYIFDQVENRSDSKKSRAEVVMQQPDRGQRYFARGGSKLFPLAFIALAIGVLFPATSGRAAEVAVAIHLDADSVEIIRGMRRANGIDPPDRAADQRLARILTGVRDRQREQAVAARTPAKRPLASASRIRPNLMLTAWGAGDVRRFLALTDRGAGADVLAYEVSAEGGRCHRYAP